MTQGLSEQCIRATCRALIGSRPRVSGRLLCAELRRRFGAVGRTERVFAIWREELAQAAMPAAARADAETIADLRRRLDDAEARAAQLLARAERAELREEAHQVRWAAEIDRLRMEVARLRRGG